MLRSFVNLQAKLILFQFKYLSFASLSTSIHSATQKVNRVAWKPRYQESGLLFMFAMHTGKKSFPIQFYFTMMITFKKTATVLEGNRVHLFKTTQSIGFH